MLNPAVQSISGTANTIPNSSKEEQHEKDKGGNSANTPNVNPLNISQELVLPQITQLQNDFEHQNVKSSTGKWVNPDKPRKFESEPYPQTSYLRKYYSGKDRNLPQELKELFTPLKCNLCHCSMGSTVTAKDHYEGKKHISNIKKWLAEHPEYSNQYQMDKIQQKTIEPGRLYCKHCDLMLSSEQQAQSHYTGKKHQSMVNSSVMNGYFNIKTSQWESSARDSDSRFGFGIGYLNGVAPANQRFFCETCQIACPSLITFNDHLSGAKHKKKMTLLLDSDPPPATTDNILEDVIKNDKKPTSPADLSIYRTPSGKYYCHSCNVTVNSPIQFLQHSDSRKHKHKASNKMLK